MPRAYRLLGLLAVAAAAASGVSAEPAPGLKLKKARIKLGPTGIAKGVTVRARMTGGASAYRGFDPRNQPIDFFVNDVEILCVPGWEDPDPTPYPYPGPGWTLEQLAPARWLYESDTREVVLDLDRGTIVLRADDVDLADLNSTGPLDVRLSLQLGDKTLGAEADFRTGPKAWRLKK